MIIALAWRSPPLFDILFTRTEFDEMCASHIYSIKTQIYGM